MYLLIPVQNLTEDKEADLGLTYAYISLQVKSCFETRLGRPLWKLQQPQGAIQVVPKLCLAVVHPRPKLEKKGRGFLVFRNPPMSQSEIPFSNTKEI